MHRVVEYVHGIILAHLPGYLAGGGLTLYKEVYAMKVRALVQLALPGVSALVPVGGLADVSDALGYELVSRGKAVLEDYTEQYPGVPALLRSISNHIPGVPLFAFPRSAADHQAAAGFSGGGTPTVTYTTIGGIPVIGITSNGGQCQFDANAFSARLLPSGKISVLYYVPDPAAFTGALILLLGDSGYANYFLGTCYTSQLGVPGWYVATIDPPATGIYSSLSGLTDQRRWTVGGGSPDFASTNFTNLRLRLSFPASPNSTVYIAGVWYGEKNVTPSIVVTADDGWDDHYDTLAPICERYGIRMSLALIGGLIGNTGSGYLSAAQARELVARGHECVVHGNPAGGGNLGVYTTVADIRADIAANREAIRQHGLFRGGLDERCYAYPQGVYQHSAGDTRILDALKAEKMVAARATNRFSQNIVNRFTGFNSRYALSVVGHSWDAADEAANVSRVILRMQQAVAEGRSPILVFHKIVASPAATDEITAANATLIIEAAAELVRAGSARFETMSEFAQRYLDAGEISL